MRLNRRQVAADTRLADTAPDRTHRAGFPSVPMTALKPVPAATA